MGLLDKFSVSEDTDMTEEDTVTIINMITIIIITTLRLLHLITTIITITRERQNRFTEGWAGFMAEASVGSTTAVTTISDTVAIWGMGRYTATRRRTSITSNKRTDHLE